MKKITGEPTSDGIAIGLAYKWERMVLKRNLEFIDEDKINDEINSFKITLEKTKDQITNLINGVDDYKTKEILNTHLALLDDPYLNQLIYHEIRNNLCCVEKAMEQALKQITKDFENADRFFLERLNDVQDVFTRLSYTLRDKEMDSLSHLENVILVAKQLSPSDVVSLNRKKVLGFVTDFGGRTSHTAILARDMGLPAVVNCKSVFDEIDHNSLIIVDGAKGEILINPSSKIIDYYKDMQREKIAEKNRYSYLHRLDAITKDGKLIEIGANVGNQNDIDMAVENGAKGIGLFRTEFLFLNNQYNSSENAQIDIYKSAIEYMDGHPVTIRTFDMGGDKGIFNDDSFDELNPALGYRGIRYSLDLLSVFTSQIRAILIASAYGKVRILFPMIISLEEIIECKKILKQCMLDLYKEGKPFDKDIETGIMIETPSAVVMAESFIKHVDFFSIGSNDLTQHILAVDRTNDKIGDMFRIEHPAVLRSINHIINTAHKHNKQVEICGEFAGNKYVTILLLGMGVDRFSMSSNYIPEIKSIFRRCSFDYAKMVAENTLNMETVKDINDYITEMFKTIV